MLSEVLIETGAPEAIVEAEKLRNRAEYLALGLCDKNGTEVPREEDRNENWYDTFVIAWHR